MNDHGYCASCGQFAHLHLDSDGKRRCDDCRTQSDASAQMPMVPFNAAAICSRDGHRWYRTAQDWNTLRCERCKATRRADKEKVK